jgi:hypothetical protein
MEDGIGGLEIDVTKGNTETLIYASKEIGLETNVDLPYNLLWEQNLVALFINVLVCGKGTTL